MERYLIYFCCGVGSICYKRMDIKIVIGSLVYSVPMYIGAICFMKENYSWAQSRFN